MKVVKICFVFEQEHWDEARELLTEQDIRNALLVGGTTELQRVVMSEQIHEIDEILADRNA